MIMEYALVPDTIVPELAYIYFHIFIPVQLHKTDPGGRHGER